MFGIQGLRTRRGIIFENLKHFYVCMVKVKHWMFVNHIDELLGGLLNGDMTEAHIEVLT